MLIRDHYLGNINYHRNTKLESPTDGDLWVYGDHTHTVQPTCIISVKYRKIRSKFHIYQMDATTQG